MALFRRAPAEAFGLDISPTGVKFVQLRKTAGALYIEAAGNTPFPPNVIVNAEIVDTAGFQKHIIDSLQPYDQALSSSIVASLPESKTFIQSIAIPKAANEPFQKRLVETLPEYIPLPVEESYYDAQIIREEGDHWLAVVGAAPRGIVDLYLKVLQETNRTPLVLDIEAPAIVRAILRNNKPHTGTTALIDLGRSHAALIFLDHDVIQFTTSVPIAGDAVTAAIAQSLNLTIEQAEKAKQTCGLDPEKCEGSIRDILEGMVADLVTQITQTQSYYEDHFPNTAPLEQIILCGGGAHLLSLDTYLANALRVPVSIAQPWSGIKGTLPESPLALTTALGLALRAIDVRATL